MAAVSSAKANTITIQRNEWAEAQSTDGISRILVTYKIGSDFVTSLANKERKWAIMVRTGLDSNATETFEKVLQRAKELNSGSFEGMKVKIIGGQPQYWIHYEGRFPREVIKEISGNQIPDDNLGVLAGVNHQAYEGMQIDALDGKAKLGEAKSDSMECTPISAKEAQGKNGWIIAKKVLEKAEEEMLDGEDFVLVEKA